MLDPFEQETNHVLLRQNVTVPFSKPVNVSPTEIFISSADERLELRLSSMDVIVDSVVLRNGTVSTDTLHE